MKRALCVVLTRLSSGVVPLKVIQFSVWFDAILRGFVSSNQKAVFLKAWQYWQMKKTVNYVCMLGYLMYLSWYFNMIWAILRQISLMKYSIFVSLEFLNVKVYVNSMWYLKQRAFKGPNNITQTSIDRRYHMILGTPFHHPLLFSEHITEE